MLTLFYSQENIFFLIEKIQVKEIDPKNLGEAILTKAFAVSTANLSVKRHLKWVFSF